MWETRGGRVIGLAAWMLVTFAAAGIGGIGTGAAGGFYDELTRPAWAPAAYVFGPVWTVLYLLMAISAWLVWKARGFGGASTALTLYLTQLAANALWSWIFFAWREGALAFVEILVLLTLLVATVAAFWRIRRLAGVLLLPYVVWVSYATVLTYSVWQLNPDILG